MDFLNETGFINQMVYQQSEPDTYDYFKQRLEEAKEKSDALFEGLFCHALGAISYKVGLFGRAIAHFNNAIECYLKAEDTSEYSHMLQLWENLEIAFAHAHINQTKLAREQLDKLSFHHDIIGNVKFLHHFYLLESTLLCKEEKADVFPIIVDKLLQLPFNSTSMLRDFAEFLLLFQYSVSLCDFSLADALLKRLELISTLAKRNDFCCQFTECKVLYFQATKNLDCYRQAFLELIALSKLREEEYKKIKETNILLKDIIFQQYEQKIKTNKRIESLKEIAEIDALTKLPNRYRIEEYGPQQLERARNEQKNLGVLLMDIDYFKLYNDQFGHLIGDQCLCLLGNILLKYKEKAFTSRLSGDEFLVIFYDQTEDQIKEFCHQINQELKEHEQFFSKDLPYGHLTISQGIVNDIPSEDNTWEDFMRRADYALYKGKRSTKNQINFVNQLP